MTATIRIGDTLLVLNRIRGCRCTHEDNGTHTLVWLDDTYPHALVGDHVAAIEAALECRASSLELEGRRLSPSSTSHLAILESPYAGDVERHTAYARAAMRDAFKRGFYPYAGHLLYTQPGILADAEPTERALGIAAHLAWAECARTTLVYKDLGVSPGMLAGLERARAAGRAVIELELGGVAVTAIDGHYRRYGGPVLATTFRRDEVTAVVALLRTLHEGRDHRPLMSSAPVASVLAKFSKLATKAAGK